ncbi:conserved hypothetical protein [Pyrobaculum islandicum DSM 4184]|uniref:Uncharacterized protein n=1 Tax=Pyrobaculum islandicum (strain DSM 4184 / JCM 9189 / GEO3) TaxID=384616 RepID=A1RVW7_PYRIL|nr:hypothetical protein [Pyrobaculum islandicum]ABL89099.1 conserved hypothetical protein [Pyrobaculum islandicum DSM 4184]
MLLEVGEDGVYAYRVGGDVLRGRVVAVATADDIIKASNLGYTFVAAKVFLPEAVEEAGKRGIRLVSIEEIAEPLSVLLVNLLANRRGDMLIRLFDQLIPSFMTRTYYYYEYMDYNRGDVYATSFKATVKVHERFYSEVFGDLVELLSELSMRMGKTRGVQVEFATRREANSHVVSLEFTVERPSKTQ